MLCRLRKLNQVVTKVSDTGLKRITICILNRRIQSMSLLLTGRDNKAEGKDHENSFTHHWVEPSDPDSNIRKIVFAKPTTPTAADEDLKVYRDETYEWNHSYWKQHNQSFFEKKKAFAKRVEKAKGLENGMELSDEMSIFYKDFLDKNYVSHMAYNK
eukprot:gene19867-21809_t